MNMIAIINVSLEQNVVLGGYLFDILKWLVFFEVEGVEREI